jgi:hypothetical protein
LVGAYGRVERTQKLLLIDERRCQGRPVRDFQETLIHEIAHMVHGPAESHGPRFKETLRRLLAFVVPEPADEPAKVASRPSLTPPKGVRYDGRPVTWAGADDWEFR